MQPTGTSYRDARAAENHVVAYEEKHCVATFGITSYKIRRLLAYPWSPMNGDTGMDNKIEGRKMMNMDDTQGRFQHRRAAGERHHTYGVEVRGLGYSIKLDGRLMKTGSSGILSEDANPKSVLKVFAINDIENLVGMTEE